MPREEGGEGSLVHLVKLDEAVEAGELGLAPVHAVGHLAVVVALEIGFIARQMQPVLPSAQAVHSST